MKDQTYTEFKEEFYSKFEDLALLDCQDFNVLKIVLDGLKVDYLKRGKYKTYLFYPSFIHRLYLFLKRIKSIKKSRFKELKKYANRKYLIVDPARYKKSNDNSVVSTYFHHFYQQLSDFTSVSEHYNKHQLFDFSLQELHQELMFEPLSKDEIRLRKELKSCYTRITQLNKFSNDDLENIRIAFDQFFKSYRSNDRIIKVLKPELAYLVCHYHKEGLMLALKRNGVKSIELQHGLIAPEDIFYIFPDRVKCIKEKALFADEIWVYGDFWKQRLLKGAEYAENQIKVVGYYQYENRSVPDIIANQLTLLKNDKKVLLFTSQVTLAKEVSEYLLFLANDIKKKQLDYVIWLKMHPSENKNMYATLDGVDNIVIVEENPEYLFAYANLVVSVFSTTLYDAFRYNLPCFSLYIKEFADYVNSVVESGVAELIYNDQNPIEFLSNSSKANVSEYYQECDKNDLKKICTYNK
jgi:hypothetical protein